MSDVATTIAALLLGSISAGSLSAGALARYTRRTIERRRAHYALRDIPPLMRATADGTIARITGTIVAGQTLVAPITGRPCVAYRARVAPRGALANRAPFGPLEELQLAPFTIDNVHVESANTRFDLPPARLRPSVEQRDRYDAFLYKYRLWRHHTMWGKYGPEFEEIILEPGARVTVAGLVMHDLAEHIAGEVGFRDGAPVRVRIVGNAEHPIVIGLPVD